MEIFLFITLGIPMDENSLNQYEKLLGHLLFEPRGFFPKLTLMSKILFYVFLSVCFPIVIWLFYDLVVHFPEALVTKISILMFFLLIIFVGVLTRGIIASYKFYENGFRWSFFRFSL